MNTLPCTSCGTETEWDCTTHDSPLCAGCECVWVVENRKKEHVIRGTNTPYTRWYMSKWPRHLPPPKQKRMARNAELVAPHVERMLETMCRSLASVWDRSDALLAIAEVATRLHARDRASIDAWNEYVKRENTKRGRRVLQGWRNNYHARTLDK